MDMFFVTQIVYNLDGAITKSIYDYNTMNSAMGAAYSALGSYMKKETEYAGILVIVARNDGHILLNKYQVLTAPQSETEGE